MARERVAGADQQPPPTASRRPAADATPPRGRCVSAGRRRSPATAATATPPPPPPPAAVINRMAAGARPACRRGVSATPHSRPGQRSRIMDLNHIPSSTHGHDFHSGQSRVVMVRKTEQRTFQVPQDGEEKPKFEKVTRETVQTFNGQRVQKTTTRRVFTDSDRGGEMRQAIVIETHEEVVGGPMPGQSSRPGPSQNNRGPAGAMMVGPMSGQYNRQQPTTSSKSDWDGPAPSQADRATDSNKGQMDNSPSQTSQNRPSPSGSSQAAGNRQPGSSQAAGNRQPGSSQTAGNRQPGRSQTAEPKGQKSAGSISHGGGGARGPSIREPQKDRSAPGPSTSPKGAQAKSKKKSVSPGRKEDGGEYTRFAEDCLLAHNKYRSKHNVPPLKLNKKLCQFSEEWAKRLASTGQMQHRPNSDYGENLFCVWSSDPNHRVTGNEPVDNWYAEIKDFIFGQEPRDLRAGHFTQVVWRDSKQLGVALAKSKNGQSFVVCNYDPPGNFIGNFSSQVPPVGGSQQSQAPPAPSKKEKPKESTASPKSQKSSKDDESKDDSSSGGSDSRGGDETKRPESGPKHTRESDTVLMNENETLHNELRAKHGCPPLRNDRDLSRHAKEWADTLIRENKFAHRPNNKYGENIFCHWTNDPAAADSVGAKDAVNAWYSEIKDFRFGEEPRTLKSGHFTQVIWKNSKRVGVGRARDGKGRVIIVANYDPRGNYVGQFTNNCPPLQK